MSITPKHLDWSPEGSRSASSSAPVGWLAAELRGVPEGERSAALGRRLREQVSSILELEDPRRLDPNRPLFELGLNSVRALEVRDVLSASLAVALPATLLFDHPTLAALTTSLAREVLGVAPPEPPAPPPAQGLGLGLMDEIEQLSEEEAAALLRSVSSS